MDLIDRHKGEFTMNIVEEFLKGQQELRSGHLEKENPIALAGIASVESMTEEVIIRFSNSQRPQKATEIVANLSAVCCPSFSLS